MHNVELLVKHFTDFHPCERAVGTLRTLADAVEQSAGADGEHRAERQNPVYY